MISPDVTFNVIFLNSKAMCRWSTRFHWKMHALIQDVYDRGAQENGLI